MNRWTDKHQNEVLKLYLASPGHGFDDGDEDVKKLSPILGRSAASISYKLANYRFLDPDAEELGKTGMSGVSRGDITCWLKMANRPLSSRALALVTEKGWSDLIEQTTMNDAKFALATSCETCIQKSLLTKPFSILTGASGTGKTKLAERLVAYLSDGEGTNHAVVPVGADWTDNRQVLGFVNHLRTVEDGRSVFQTTPIVDLLLHANEISEVPHFLILDEMNLSHVERYFADFLSVMEQSDGELNFHGEGDDDTYLPRFEGDDLGVPRSIPYPKNLFVIGTVNIDETTYMFSPKVLDRANVIEFTVKKGEIADFLNDPKPYPAMERAEDGVAEGFLALAKQAVAGELAPLADAPKKAAANHLTDLFVILKAGRFEFAYRTANEVMRYLTVCAHLAEKKDAWNEGGWKSDLDDQILQKILPKLHGSMGRVGGLLSALTSYCHSGEVKDAENPNHATMSDALKLTGEGAHFPKSFAKLQSMLRTLKDEQFVSFIQ